MCSATLRIADRRRAAERRQSDEWDSRADVSETALNEYWGRIAMFLLDELYKNDNGYPSNGSYVEKFLYYKERDDDIDADVCLQNVDIYLRTNPLVGAQAEIVPQPENNKAKKKYEIHDGSVIYRGETLINCMQFLLQIVNFENENGKIWTKDHKEIRNGLNHSRILNANNGKLGKLTEQFVEKCYSSGNFFAIPFSRGASLNLAKGRLKKQGYQYMFMDNSDTYFKVCFDYFVNGKRDVQLTRLIDEKYDCWKKCFSQQENPEGWKAFIEYHQFESFMNTDDDLPVPLQLWEKTGEFEGDVTRYLERAIEALSVRENRIKNIAR